jgi:quercetin dioxygenase-like cupin family protein
VVVAAAPRPGASAGGERLIALEDRRVGLRKGCVLALLLVPLAPFARAQTQPASTDRAPLAAAHLASVVDLPLYFRLYHARLPAAQSTFYQGSNAMLYDLSGDAAITIDGGATQALAEGAGAFLATGQQVTISAASSEPAELLLFVLTALPNQRPPLDRPAAAVELYRTPDALPGLKAGPYEFSLTRVTFPAGMPPDQPHYRTGAALDCVIAGAGTLTADGKTEPRPTGAAQDEPHGWVHQWANPGETPLVVLEANISREGEPAVQPTAEK